jgi:glycosyltransferase involved in cell wall biosynthesis
MLLLDLSHTSHTQARTGVQRVALELRRACRATLDVQEITHDPYEKTWRPLQEWELTSLDRPAAAAKKRGASWPLQAQFRGWWQHRTRTNPRVADFPSPVSGIVFPEVFTVRTARALPGLFSALTVPKVALFHDAIALRLPELSPPNTVARFPSYLEELRQFDGIAAVSEDSRQSLLDYWKWAGWKENPEVITLPLGCDHLALPPPQAIPHRAKPVLKILSVGSLEGRKNHLTLLQACEKLWTGGQQFELEIMGGLQRETGAAAFALIGELQRSGRALTYRGWLSDSDLVNAYESADFTVYPSLMEGFGLPVWESLLRGKPCICTDRGAVAETARGGGCLTVDTCDRAALAESIASLLNDQSRLAELTAAARARQPNRWSDYASELNSWISTLPTKRNLG